MFHETAQIREEKRRSDQNRPDHPQYLYLQTARAAARARTHEIAAPKPEKMGGNWLMGTMADGLIPILQHLEQKHGPRANWPSPASGAPSYQCPRCRDQGWLQRCEPNPAASVPIYRAVPCSACNAGDDAVADRETLWRLSGVTPAERQRCTLPSFVRTVNPQMQTALAAAAAWGQGSGPPFLLLVGEGRGIGKTHLAVAAAGECIARGVAVCYAVVPRLLGDLRATMRPDSRLSLADARRRVEDYPALVLDDFGAGTTSAWAATELFTIINERWRAERRTLITSNVRPAQIAASTLSRLRDRRLARIVPCAGRDYRAGAAGTDRSAVELRSSPGGGAA